MLAPSAAGPRNDGSTFVRQLVVGSAAILLVAALGTSAGSQSLPACSLPDAKPLWIDYAGSSVPEGVRDVLARPGAVLAASGTTLPEKYREQGAKSAFFVLNLPRLVGDPTQPANRARVDRAVDQTYERAVASVDCSTPLIGLNELHAPDATLPWSAPVAHYRENVLALVRGLAAKGAQPHLFVHGSPIVTGQAAKWWHSVGAVSGIVYETYYSAPAIARFGRIVGPRRLRLGMRSIIRKFVSVGVPRDHMGLALGFQVAPGKFGREGLEPRQKWLRVVKWNALAAKQVTLEEHTSTIWSWGWANFGPQSIDPDKPAAACVYLWARDQRLCNGPAAAGTGFNRSLVEGSIVMPHDVACISDAGELARGPILALAGLTRDRQQALDALFSRMALAKRVPVVSADVLAAEQDVIDRAFGGSRTDYLLALQQRGATRQIALGILEDELRRDRIAQLVRADPDKTTLTWAASVNAAAIATATCRRDLLPGRGSFPASDVRVIGAVPLASKLTFPQEATFPASDIRVIGAVPLASKVAFLRADTEPPAPAAGLAATTVDGAPVLDWPDGTEPDLAGYVVYRATTPGGPYTRLTPTLLPYSTYADREPLSGSAVYVVRAMDTSGNLSAPSVEASAPLHTG